MTALCCSFGFGGLLPGGLRAAGFFEAAFVVILAAGAFVLAVLRVVFFLGVAVSSLAFAVSVVFRLALTPVWPLLPILPFLAMILSRGYPRSPLYS